MGIAREGWVQTRFMRLCLLDSDNRGLRGRNPVKPRHVGQWFRGALPEDGMLSSCSSDSTVDGIKSEPL